jgi:RimJ/RimL family protein N-acetyltransferase
MFSLKTDRLVLRDFRPDDFEAFYATSTDPEYGRFYPERELAEAHWRQIFERILPPADRRERRTYQLALCLLDGTLIGTCGVRLEDVEHRQASFGCAIASRYWGKGLAYEGSHRVIEFGFSSLGIERLYAETISANRGARALAERLGMRLEGEFRHHRFFRNRWWNTAIYAVLREEWETSRE